MLLTIPAILNADGLKQARAALAKAPWGDGRLTAGAQAALAKNNQQLPENCEPTRVVQQLLLKGIQSNPTFFAAALPKYISPPLVNRYGGQTNSYGDHIDSGVRLVDGGGRVRTDISCTVFLTDPADYDGGELVIVEPGGNRSVKLAAGDLVMYPGTTVHRVEPVTRGYRVACFFWVQSMVRSEEQRRLLYEMDQHLIRLRPDVGESHPSAIGLTGTYHNLLRLWLDV